MRLRVRLALTVLLTVLLGVVWGFASALMNMPSDFANLAGLALFLVLFVLGPTGYWLIFRRSK